MGIEEDKAELIAAAIVSHRVCQSSDWTAPMVADDFAFGELNINNDLIGENLVTPSEVEAALNLLAVKGIVTHHPSEYAKTRWIFDAAKAEKYRDDQMQDKSSLEYQAKAFGEEWINESLINMRNMEGGQHAPASDRFVSLDDNRQGADEKAGQAKKLAELVGKGNEAGDLIADADERIFVAQQMDSLGDFLKLPKVEREAVRPAYERLKWFTEKLTEGGIYQLAKEIFDWMSKIFFG